MSKWAVRLILAGMAVLGGCITIIAVNVRDNGSDNAASGVVRAVLNATSRPNGK